MPRGWYRAVLFLLQFANFGLEIEAYQQPNDNRRANDTLVVQVDDLFVHSYDPHLGAKVREMVTEISQRILKRGAVNINFYSTAHIQITPDITAVFSVTSCEDLWRSYNKGRKFDILFIALTEPNCPRLPPESGITMPLYERGHEVPQIILDLRNMGSIRWESAAIIFDDTVDDDTVRSTVNVLNRNVPSTDSSCAVALYRINVTPKDLQSKKKKDEQDLLLNMPPHDMVHNYLVLVEQRKIPLIFEMAKKMRLVDPSTEWLFIVNNRARSRRSGSKRRHVPPEKRFVDLIEEGENVAFLINVTKPELRCEVGLLCNTKQLVEKLIVAVEKSIEQEIILAESLSDEEWDVLRPSKTERRSNILEYVKRKSKEGRTDCDSCTQWNIRSSDSWGKDFLPMPATSRTSYNDDDETSTAGGLVDVGYWQPRTGPVLSDHLFPNVMGGFRGRRMPISTVHYPPWQFVKYDKAGRPYEYSGVVINILDELAKKMNFTYEMTLLPNGTSGSNSSAYVFHEALGEIVIDSSVEYAAWNRIVTDLKSRKTFLGAVGFVITEDRKAQVNFTVPIAVETYAFLVARPQVLSRALLFVQPFTGESWLCIAATVLAVGPLLYFVHRTSPFYDHYSHRGKGGYTKLYNCFWYLYGALLQQGGGVMPEADSGRLVIGTWWLVVLVIVTSYSGSLVAFLTFPKMDKIVSNIDELLERSAFNGKGVFTWSFPKVSTIHELLKQTDNKKLNLLYEAGEKLDRLTPEVISKIRQGEHVYIQRKSMMLYIMKQEYLRTHQCDYSIGDEEVLDERIGLAIASNSPYLKIINKHIYDMHKVGLINKWHDDSLPEKDECWMSTMASSSSTHTVNMDDMQGCFFLLFMGVFLAILFLAGEFFSWWWKKKKQKNIIQPFIS
ncbi:Ligand-gated ion channel [Nesidiocoris tenuis]|uniref:Ligand-gated ion channel n=1 Tax=Nesidiocoris tenuis TaxID=355587 RepID=A0ABN7B7W5_9HEMI|nr:Ligand-gated ion channel [Nesidiocoris tenuis]